MPVRRLPWSGVTVGRPEWWVVAGVALAWVLLVAGHVVDPSGGHGAVRGSLPASGGTFPAALGDWTLMSIAMMTPVTLPAVHHVALNSFRYRRIRAMSLYLGAYAGVWVTFGVLALAVVELLLRPGGVDPRHLGVASLVMAAVWQVSRPKRRALLGCRRTVPLRPYGLRADAACLRFGVQQGLRCLRSCWALMWLMAVVGHTDLVLVVGLTAFITAEELTRIGRRLTVPFGAMLAGVGLLVAVA